ncbi:MAG: GNAT family N-acetyltransferase [Pyrobaculum sp.]
MEVEVNKTKALEILETYYHGPVKYAKAVLERWPLSNGLVVYKTGRPAGAEIFYRVDLAQPTCVHYYLIVAPQFQRQGVATYLANKVGEICGAEVFLATTTVENMAAVGLFKKLGYMVYRWPELPRKVRDVLLKATCGYDDDILFIKGAEPTQVAKPTAEVQKLWRETCLLPYFS